MNKYPCITVSLRYHTCAIITRGLYISYPIFEVHFLVFKEVFSENSVFILGWYSRVITNQGRVIMQWRTNSIWNRKIVSNFVAFSEHDVWTLSKMISLICFAMFEKCFSYSLQNTPGVLTGATNPASIWCFSTNNAQCTIITILSFW